MPPKAAPAEKGIKTFSADVVAAVLFSTGTTTISKKSLEIMSALDGTKTASGFEHDFRSVIAKAKELKARVESGEEFEPVQPIKKRGATTASPATPRKRKGDSDIDTPSKKKATTKKKATPKKSETPVDNGIFDDQEELPLDAQAFFKEEQDWGNDYA